MYSREQRIKAVGLFIKYGKRSAPVIAELGYPNRHSLTNWYKDYLAAKEAGEEYLPPDKVSRTSKFSIEQKQNAVDHYLEHGRSLTYTCSCLGYPSRQSLSTWVDELAPGSRRRILATSEPPKKIPESVKIKAVKDLCTRSGTAAEVAEKYGVGRTAPYIWKHAFLGKGGGCKLKDYTSDLPEDIGELRAMCEELQVEVARLRLERDILEGTAELLKKDPSVNPANLTNREKAQLIDALREAGHKLGDLLGALSMAKSSYEYHRKAASAPDKYADARAAIVEEFEAVNASRGYRYIRQRLAQREDPIEIGEKKVRELMAEEGCAVVYLKRKRKYSSYKGEISEAPDNLVKRNFHAIAPNELWLTDITEFKLPAAGAPKVYLSPILDCFDGMLASWSIGTSPNAELANSSLESACSTLEEGDTPCCHNDRGCHYRWPGWIAICDAHNITRSMSKKGCSPDNSACEGLFGRIKNEFFYYRDWSGVTVEEFIAQLDAYLHYYNEERAKESLGWMSPLQYRRSLGLAA